MNRQLFNAMIAQYGEKTVSSIKGAIEWSGGAHCNLSSLNLFGMSNKVNDMPLPETPTDIHHYTGVYSVNSESEYIRTPTLRGFNGYSDEWNYVTGRGIRKVKEIIFDGVTNKITEWDKYAKMGFINIPEEPIISSGNAYVMSTHFSSLWNTNHGSIYAMRYNLIVMVNTNLSSIDEWNAWLKEQYDAGTPVKVCYILAEPQEFYERVEGCYNKPIPNDGGRIQSIDGNISGGSFELSYIAHAPLGKKNLLDINSREIVNFGATANTSKRTFTGNGIIKGYAYNNYYNPAHVISFEKRKNGFRFTNNANQTSYGIGFDFKLLPNTTYTCSFDGLKTYNGSSIFLTEFDGEGNFLRYVLPKTPDKGIRTFTTSADAVWGVFSFQNRLNETTQTYGNVVIGIES